jgi:diguanylate cyclase (GGDEF)-like protein
MALTNSTSITDKVFIEQVILLYIKPPGRALVHLIPALMIYWLVRGYAPPIIAVTWLITLTVINILRYLDISSTRTKLHTITDYRVLETKFALGCGALGTAYGLGLFLFLPLLPHLNQITVLGVIVTVIPVALVSFSTNKLSFLLYFLPALGLPVFQCLLQGDLFHIYIAIFGIIYLYVVITLFDWHYDVLTEAINLRLTNQGLVISLTGSNKQLEALNKRLEAISTVDSLTNLANRRYFDDALQRELLRAQRAKTPISLIMLDIDFFKQYNDEYGHVTGDNCLRLISTVLQENVKRPGDMAARYGGEEFCIIMPETDQKGAYNLAEQIKQEVESLNIPHAKSKIVSHVTVSMGTATTIPGLHVTTTMLINAADKALYTAKRDGRNTIRSSNITPA